MPDFVAVAHSIEFRVSGYSQATGKKMYNISHVDCAPTLPTLADCQLVADTVADWVVNHYRFCYASDILVNEVRARSNAQEPGPVALNSTVNQVGSLTADRLPMAQTLCVNMLSGYTGLRRRGKWYTFVADEASQTAGLYTSGYVTVVEAKLEELRVALDGVGFALAVESRRDLALWQVISFLAQPIPSTLQSRKPNHGI